MDGHLLKQLQRTAVLGFFFLTDFVVKTAITHCKILISLVNMGINFGSRRKTNVAHYA